MHRPTLFFFLMLICSVLYSNGYARTLGQDETIGLDLQQGVPEEHATGEDISTIYHARADSALMVNDFTTAIGSLGLAMKATSNEEVRANIQWQIAGIYSYFKLDPLAASKEYRRFIERFPGDSRIGEAHFRLGKIYISLHDPNKAVAHLKSIEINGEYYDQAQNLLSWLRSNWKTETYYGAKKIMIGISALEIAFVICWILLGNETQLHILIKRPRFIGLFILVLIFLCIKLYFNFMLYNLLQGMIA